MIFLTALNDWSGPVNAGSGCLSCVQHCLRGISRWFARDAVPYRNCLDGSPPPEVCLSASISGEISHRIYNYTARPVEIGGDGYERTLVIDQHWTASGSWSLHAGGVKTSHFTRDVDDTDSPPPRREIDETLEDNECPAKIVHPNGPLVVSTAGDTTTWTGSTVAGNDGTYGDYFRRREYWNPSTSTGVTVFDDNPAPGAGWYLTSEVKWTSTGSVEHVSVYGPDEQTEDDATAEVNAAVNDTSIWGSTKETQFPPMGCYGSVALGGGFSTSPESVNFSDIQNPSSVLYPHNKYGRQVLRARLTVGDNFYPGQKWELSWSEIVRRMGYGVARSGSGRGKTTRTRTRTFTLSDLMPAPDDGLGNMATGDASWASLGYALQDIPATPAAPDPPLPPPSPTGGFRAASLTRRSFVRFAVPQAGAFNFRVRKVEVLDSDPTVYTTTLATIAVAGSVGADGLNASAEFFFEPADNLHSVYLFLDWVKDGLGEQVGDYVCVAKIRDGWQGFRQLDHATLQAGSQFYRVKTFTQTTSETSEFIPDPDAPPPDLECLNSLPWLDFSQTQTWTKGIVAGAESPWALTASNGSGNDLEWTGEVSPYDPPSISALSSAPTATTWTQTETDDPGVSPSGATWTSWDRVVPTPNPFFGGKVLQKTDRSSPAVFYSYPDEDVWEGPQIYLYAVSPGTASQIVGVQARGIA